jgi:hypothetical protein
MRHPNTLNGIVDNLCDLLPQADIHLIFYPNVANEYGSTLIPEEGMVILVFGEDVCPFIKVHQTGYIDQDIDQWYLDTARSISKRLHK